MLTSQIEPAPCRFFDWNQLSPGMRVAERLVTPYQRAWTHPADWPIPMAGLTIGANSLHVA